ncbi:MAG: hypothetical protein M1821_007296, partial [Bathelium mastoideum]
MPSETEIENSSLTEEQKKPCAIPPTELDVEKTVSVNAASAGLEITPDIDDRNIVDFESENDPANPLNWAKAYRMSMLILVSLMSLVITLATVVCTPAIPQVLHQFGSTNAEDSIIIVSIWEIGEIVGVLLLAPASEIFGRLPVWHTASILFVIFSVGLALSDSLRMIIAFRFINGMAYPVVLNAAMAGDMFRREERGSAITVISMAPLIGPTFGPTFGGLLAQYKGWRWTFWFIAILSAAVELLLLIFLRETYAPKVLETKVKKMRKATGNQSLRSKFSTSSSMKDMVLRAIVRPLKFLIFSPISTLLSLYLATIYGYLYLILTTLTEVFQSTYHFSEADAG